MKNIPNMITLLRIIIVPFFPYVYFNFSPQYALLIYILAGITDILDGYIARKYDLITKLGTVLDPLADKLMLLIVLSTLTIDHILPLFILVIIGIKEISMIITGVILYIGKNSTVIPSNIFGKISTALFFAAVVETIIFNQYFINIFLFSSAFIFKLIALLKYSKKLSYIRKNTFQN